MAEGQVTFLFQQRGAQTVRQQVEQVAATLRGTAAATRDTAFAGDLLVDRFRALQQQARLGQISQQQYAQQLRTTLADLRGFAATTNLSAESTRHFATQAQGMQTELSRVQAGSQRTAAAATRVAFGVQTMTTAFAGGRLSVQGLSSALLVLNPGSALVAGVAAAAAVIAAGYTLIRDRAKDAKEEASKASQEFARLGIMSLRQRRLELQQEIDTELTRGTRTIAVPFAQELVTDIDQGNLERLLARREALETRLRDAEREFTGLLEQRRRERERDARADARDASRDTAGAFAGGRQFIDERLAAQQTRSEGLAMLMEQARAARESGFAGDIARERRRGQAPALDPFLRDLIGGQAESVKSVTAALEDQERAWARTAEQARVFGSAAGEAVGGLIDAAASGKNILEAFFTAGLKALAQEARAKAIFETAEGFASLFSITKGGGVGAAAHFRAAALYGAAAVALGAAAGSAGGGGGGGGGAGAFRSGAAAEGRTQEPTRIVFRGRSRMIDLNDPRQYDEFVRALQELGGRRADIRFED